MLPAHFKIRGSDIPDLLLKACRGELDLTIPANSDEAFKLKKCHELPALIAGEKTVWYDSSLR